MYLITLPKLKIYFFLCLVIYVPIAIVTWILVNSYTKTAGLEILNSWLQTEAINIQEGNLLSSFSSHRRILLSSQLVTGMSLVDDQSNHQIQNLISFGEKSKIVIGKDISPGVAEIDQVGPFHLRIYYRFPEHQNLLILFDLKPPLAGWIFFGSSFMFFAFIVVTLLIGAMIRRKEEDKRIGLLKSVLSELNSRATPSPELTVEFPSISSSWSELKLVVENLSKEIAEKSKNAAIAKMTRSLTHDLKNPLTIFEFALNCKNFDDFKLSQQEMRRSLERIHAILTNIGQKNMATKILINSDYLSLDEIVSHFVLLYGSSDITIAAKGGPWEIYGDKLAIERCLFNLVTNAVEAGADCVTIEGTSDQNDLVLTVRDNGPGVASTLVPTLFSHGATHGKPHGEGIGLWNVKSIVKAHGGDVSYSRDGQESVFTISLPSILMKPMTVVPNDGRFEEDRGDALVIKDSTVKPITKQKEILIDIRDPSRSDTIISALSDLDLVINTKPSVAKNPELIYTEDISQCKHLVKKGVKVLVDAPSKSIESAIRQIRVTLTGTMP